MLLFSIILNVFLCIAIASIIYYCNFLTKRLSNYLETNDRILDENFKLLRDNKAISKLLVDNLETKFVEVSRSYTYETQPVEEGWYKLCDFGNYYGVHYMLITNCKPKQDGFNTNS